MGIEQFTRNQHHTRPATPTTPTARDEEDDNESVLEVIYDNPRLLALLRTAARDGDLAPLHTALAELRPTGKDDLDHTVLIAELLVRLIFTHRSPAHVPDRNSDFITRLQQLGLCHTQHFEYTLIAATLEHGLARGYLDAKVYDTAQHYVTHHEPDLAGCLDDIERLPPGT